MAGFIAAKSYEVMIMYHEGGIAHIEVNCATQTCDDRKSS
jgi:hypothetical protein